MHTITKTSAAALALCAGLAHAQCNPTQLLASNRMTQDLFGTAVALTTDASNNPILFVGAIGHDETGASNLGDVYVFNNNGSFSQAQQLLPAFGTGNFQFGSAISASFPYVAISAPGGGVGGLVYVYQKIGSSWTSVYSYEPSGTNSLANFGYSVGVTASPIPRVIAGAPGYDFNGVIDCGAFFIHQNNGAWAVQTAKTGLDFAGQTTDHLGAAVAIDNALCAAGAPDATSAGQIQAGYAVVGKLGGNGSWTFTRFSASQPQALSHFGQTIAVNDAVHLIAVAAPYFDTSAADQNGALQDVGAVYIFNTAAAGAPVQVARLLPENPVANMHFGARLAFSAGRLLVSAPGTHQVYEFKQDVGGSFRQQSVLSSSTPNNDFGTSIALANNLFAVGDDLNTTSPTVWQGAVSYGYLFSGIGADTFDGAQLMLTGSTATTCTNAMTPSPFPINACAGSFGNGNDAWFTFTPACGGQIRVDSIGSSFDTVLTIHDAKPTPANPHVIACNDDIAPGNLQSQLTFDVTAGQQYWIRVAGYSAAALGDAQISLSQVFAANDDCLLARDAFPGTTLGSTCAATNSLYNALTCSGLQRTFNKDVWFTFTPTSTATYDITTCGSSFDTLLAVYPSCPGANVLPIACNDDTNICELFRSKVSPDLTAGQTYFIRLGGYDANASGDFALNISEQAPPCDPDVNQDGVSDQGDVDYLINVIAGGPNPTNIDPDINHDGVADQGDIDALINVIAGAPCP
ncbi:MAG: hypothetical protein GC200_09755 [Tepidisphaera sp.]|nr:hypothetical protein [Tepidisphaera sp.]